MTLSLQFYTHETVIFHGLLVLFCSDFNAISQQQPPAKRQGHVNNQNQRGEEERGEREGLVKPSGPRLRARNMTRCAGVKRDKEERGGNTGMGK